jgi:hypothetical protein
MRAYCVTLLALTLCCSPSRRPAGPAPTVTSGPVATRLGTDAATEAASLPSDGAIGASCTPGPDMSQTGCAPGQFCLPLEGGYCTTRCPCGEDAVCVETTRRGEFCARRCPVDDACREGYACHPAWNACVGTGFAAPRPPMCSAPALAKKTFGPARPVTTDASPGIFQMEPSAALDAEGNIVVTYVGCDLPDGPNSIVAAKVLADGRVAGERKIATGVDNQYDPWITTLRDGTLAAVWLGFDGNYGPLGAVKPQSHQQIGFATSQDGLSWSAPVRADTAARDCPGDERNCLDKPMIIAGSDARDPKREVMYVTFSGAPDELKVVRSNDGGKSFGSSVSAGGDAYGDVAVSPRGILHIVDVVTISEPRKADRLGDVRNAVEYRRSDDGGATFTKPVIVSKPNTPVPYLFSNAQIVVDEPRKSVYVVYPAGTPDGRWDLILATSKDSSAHWKRTKVNDDAPCANHMTPSAALDPHTGRVHVIWTENRTGRGGVAYASCDAGGGRCSANETVSDVPFASYGFVRHSPRWLSEYGSLLFDVKKKVLHALWTQTVETGKGAAARIFYARADVR